MQSNRKSIIKKVVDVCMTVLLLCLMAYQVTGETLHEWFGIGMTALLIVHHILNVRWYSSLFKGRYNAYRIVTAAVNTLLLFSIALTAICGMAMSSHAVPFLYGLLPVSFARRFHLAMSFWSFILMGLHLGLHVPAMAAGLKWNGRIKAAAAAVFAAISGVGLWLFIKNGIPDYIFFRTPFAFFDYDKAAILVFAENLAMLIAFAFLGGCCASFIKAFRSGSDKKSGFLRPLRSFLLPFWSLLRCFSSQVTGGRAFRPGMSPSLSLRQPKARRRRKRNKRAGPHPSFSRRQTPPASTTASSCSPQAPS